MVTLIVCPFLLCQTAKYVPKYKCTSGSINWQGGGAKYLGPGLVRRLEILVKYLVAGATVKMVGGP